MSEREKKIQAAIDKLASLYEYGHLQASIDPAALLETAADEIAKSRSRPVRVEVREVGE